MVMASVVSTLGVVLGAGLTGLNPVNYTLLVVPALAVLLVARMESVGCAVRRARSRRLPVRTDPFRR